MRTAGIIGGIGPESTIEYYRQIVASYRERIQDGSYPPLVIVSVDLKTLLDLAGSGRAEELTEFLLEGVTRLGQAGAGFGALAANTPHVVFDRLAARSPIPLISIVEVTCRAVEARAFRRVLLLGTRFTMQGRFYPDRLSRAGIDVIVPGPEDQSYVHGVYLNELVRGIIRPETRERLRALIRRLKMVEEIEAVILGGTELPLILRAGEDEVAPFLDTTRLHVEEIVGRMLSPELAVNQERGRGE